MRVIKRQVAMMSCIQRLHLKYVWLASGTCIPALYEWQQRRVSHSAKGLGLAEFFDLVSVKYVRRRGDKVRAKAGGTGQPCRNREKKGPVLEKTRKAVSTPSTLATALRRTELQGHISNRFP